VDQRVINIDEAPLSDNGNGKSFMAKVGRLGPTLGLTGLGCSLTVVAAGKRAYPFHRHHVTDEMFYVVSGQGELRLGDERRPIRAGDLIASPAGGEPHQIINTSDGELRYLGFSTVVEADILDYPDSGKVAYSAGMKNGDYKAATTKFVGRVQATDYFEGEEPPKG
jgi:uncharacterized cupin superfamily protein